MAMSKTSKSDFHNELAKTRLQHAFGHHFQTITKWIYEGIAQKGLKKDRMCVHVSDTLAADLNLMIDDTPPKCVTVQLLLIAEDFMPVLLTLYNSDLFRRVGKNTLTSVNTYTIKMAQQLKDSLMNFCHCEFVLLRFALDETSVTTETLQKAYQEQLDESWFYRGPEKLDSASFSQLKEAVKTLSAVSPIPSFLQDPPNCEVRLLLLDEDWRSSLHLFIELLTDSDQHVKHVTYEESFKVKVAALEAARRLSVQQNVFIVTEDESIEECAERIINYTKQEVGLKSRLHIKKPSWKIPPRVGSNAVIFYDCQATLGSRLHRNVPNFKADSQQSVSSVHCNHRARPY